MRGLPYSTRVLTADGWRGRGSLKAGVPVLGYDPGSAALAWTKVRHVRDAGETELLAMTNRALAFSAAAEQEWHGERRTTVRGLRARVAETFTTAGFNTECFLRTTAAYNGGDSPLTQDEAAIVGWLITDGSMRWSPLTGRTYQMGGRRRRVIAHIYQTKEPGLHTIRDRFAAWIRSDRPTRGRGRVFNLHPQMIRDLWAKAGLEPESEDWPAFVLALDPGARAAFLGAAWEAEGYSNRGTKELTQNEAPKLEAFLLAAYLCGYAPRVRPHVPGSGTFPSLKVRMVLRLLSNPFICGDKTKRTPTGRQPVWHLETGLGSCVARQGYTVTIAGA